VQQRNQRLWFEKIIVPEALTLTVHAIMRATNMTARAVVIEALNTTCGLMNRPELASVILKGGDIELDRLDIDSLSAYEVIMLIEDELDVNVKPTAVFNSRTLSELVAEIDSLLHISSQD
jgi:acyl carrier protein